MKFKLNSKKLMAYIIMPLAFLIIGYSIIYIAASPIIDAVASVWQIMKLSDKSENTEEYEDIFEQSSVYEGNVKASEINFPTVGTRYAELSIPTADIKAPVFFGDGDKELKKGLGHYAGSNFCGVGSTVLIAGHNHTFLHTIDRAQIGDTITITTPYGVYNYVINDIAVKNSNDKAAFDLGKTEENLILYTCYPLSTLGLTSQRYVVYAELQSGPRVLINE